MSGFESFCIYGFCVAYPKKYRVQLEARSRRDEGSVAFESADNGKIVAGWSPLSTAKERYPCLEEHVKESVDRIRRRPKTKKVKLIETRKLRVNSHEAIYSHIRMSFSLRRFWPFGKTFQEEVRSLHIYCKDSGRYFVVYGMTTSDRSAHQNRIFSNIIESFVCHKTNKDSR